MGIGKKIFGAIFEEEAPKEESKSPQVYQEQPRPSVIPQQVSYVVQQPIVAGPINSDKWKQYFDKLFSSLNDPKPSYHEFIATADVMGSLPANARFPAAFAGLKMQGLTRAMLLQTANSTLKAIADNSTSFQQAIDKKRKEEVTDLQDSIRKKTEDIQKLNQDIIELTTKSQMSEQKINTSISEYNMYSQQLQSKISSDIDMIKQYIIE